MITDRVTPKLHMIPVLFGSLIIIGGAMYLNIETFADRQPWYYLVVTLTLVGMLIAQYMVPVICIDYKCHGWKIARRIAGWVIFVVVSGMLVTYLDALQRFATKIGN